MAMLWKNHITYIILKCQHQQNYKMQNDCKKERMLRFSRSSCFELYLFKKCFGQQTKVLFLLPKIPELYSVLDADGT